MLIRLLSKSVSKPSSSGHLVIYRAQQSFSGSTHRRSTVNYTRYKDLVSKGEIRYDKNQTKVVHMFDDITTQIVESHVQWQAHNKTLNPRDILGDDGSGIDGQSGKKKSFFQSFFGDGDNSNGGSELNPYLGRTPAQYESPLVKKKGVYLYGTSGTGKTYLTNIFFQNLPIKEKTKLTFSEFLRQVNNQMHSLMANKDTDKTKKIALDVALKNRVLYLDEFQVHDIADALIVKSFFENLFKYDTILIATSNRPPENLYERGLQRALFVPFIDVLKKNSIVVDMNSTIDYRWQKEADQSWPTYLSPLNEQTDDYLDEIYDDLACGERNIDFEVEVIPGRKVKIPISGKRVAMFEAEDILTRDFGSNDFMGLCQNFHTIIIKNLHQIDVINRNRTRRFILMIDEVYAHNVNLYISAEVELKELFKNRGSKSDEDFAVDRCISRLVEMQSKEYLNQKSYFEQHRPTLKPMNPQAVPGSGTL